MKPRRSRNARRRALWMILGGFSLAIAVFLLGTGRWIGIYGFFAQFHQRVLWGTLLFVFLPLLLIVFLRAWGVEDLPYTVEVPELGTGTLEPLARRLRRSRRHTYDQALMVNRLSELATEVIALNEGLDEAAARLLCRSGRWNENEEVLDLIVNRRLPEVDGVSFLAQFEQMLTTIETMLKGGTEIESRPSG